MKSRWTVEEIGSSDKAGLVAWARDFCNGMDIDSAADALNVAPTANAVVDALTDSLPEDLRKQVANVCFEALGVKTTGEEQDVERAA